MKCGLLMLVGGTETRYAAGGMAPPAIIIERI